MEGPEVLDTPADICHIMMIGFENNGAIKLCNNVSTQNSVCFRL